MSTCFPMANRAVGPEQLSRDHHELSGQVAPAPWHFPVGSPAVCGDDTAFFAPMSAAVLFPLFHPPVRTSQGKVAGPCFV